MIIRTEQATEKTFPRPKPIVTDRRWQFSCCHWYSNRDQELIFYRYGESSSNYATVNLKK